jgi:hypothetical protein
MSMVTSVLKVYDSFVLLLRQVDGSSSTDAFCVRSFAGNSMDTTGVGVIGLYSKAINH